MSWKYYNPNPRGLRVGDCTVRAICAVSGEDWNTVHKLQCDLARWMGDMPSADNVWWSLLWLCGFDRVEIIKPCADGSCYTVADFARDHPRGVYVLGPMEHAVAVIDGNWLDSFDSALAVPTYFFARSW